MRGALRSLGCGVLVGGVIALDWFCVFGGPGERFKAFVLFRFVLCFLLVLRSFALVCS